MEYSTITINLLTMLIYRVHPQTLRHFVCRLDLCIYIPFLEYPSCPQATCASNPDQNPSHMVPQVSFQQISKRPSNAVVPFTSLMSAFWHSTVSDTQMKSHHTVYSKKSLLIINSVHSANMEQLRLTTC